MFGQYEWEGWTFEGLSSSGDLAFKDGRRMEAHRVILAGQWALGRLLSCWNWENFSCLQVDELQLSCLFFNPGYQPATSTYLSRCACHLPLVNMRPTSWQHKKSLFNPGFYYRTLEPYPASYCYWRCTLFSLNQAPTGPEGFVASLIFPNIRFFLGNQVTLQQV